MCLRTYRWTDAKLITISPEPIGGGSGGGGVVGGKLGRQSSNYHNCQILPNMVHITSMLWRKCNLTIFSLKSMGVFCCHGN